LPYCSRVQSGGRSRLWDTFAPVAHLEAIRILLAFAVSKVFKLYQMDVKSAFLNCVIQEEVYVRQP
jgi:folate-dependent tRNA-U54 methylase TrmFO/GidA